MFHTQSGVHSACVCVCVCFGYSGVLGHVVSCAPGLRVLYFDTSCRAGLCLEDVLWAQRDDSVYVTVDLKEVQDLKVPLASERS